MTVSLEVFIGFALIVFSGLVAWIWQTFQSNFRDHKELFHITSKVESKLDHIIQYHKPQMPEYKQDDREE